MKIGLIDIEPKIFNTAYMLISRYYKDRGDTVEWWSPITDGNFDYVFCSSLFTATDKSEVPERAICGGTGFDVKSRLSSCIEDSQYDYSIYPKCKTSYEWYSRGCIRNCSFCMVPQKEGEIKAVKPKKLNPNGTYIVVQDNNFFASPQWRMAIADLELSGQPVDFQGVDVRVLSVAKCKALASLKHHKQIKIAWDNPFEDLRNEIALLLKFINAYKIMCYVLIGHTSSHQQNVDRVRSLQQFRITPYVMCVNRKDPYQKKFQRWVNGHAYRNVKWGEFTG